MEKVADNQGLVNIQLELAVHATNSGSNVVAHDLGADHGQGFALRGVDLARHDGGARLVLGQNQLAKTTSGSAAEVSDILGNLGEGASQCVQAPGCLDNGVVRSKGLELVGGSLEFGTSHLGDFLGNSLGETFESVDAGAHSSASLCKQPQIRKRALDPLDAEVELCNIAREFLGQGQRCRILQMRPSDLDDVLGLEVVHLLLQGIAEGLNGWQKRTLELEHGGNVHNGREGVVGRGGAVDVVVGVDWLLGAHGSAEDLNGSVGNDFVGVHVGLGAGTGLPDNQREVVEQLEVGHLGGSLLNGLSDLLVWWEAML